MMDDEACKEGDGSSSPPANNLNLALIEPEEVEDRIFPPAKDLILKQPETDRPKTLPMILHEFYKVTNNTDGNINATCKTCLKAIKGHITSTSNFRSHLKVFTKT
jgi:hypothetical protein